ncbi:MAG: acyl carrier protein [Campylobacteraceae bacterium]|nr:acyl carrier protein [Campylobacteraceae bacterium]
MKAHNKIEENVVAVIKECLNSDEIDLNTNLREDLNIDSVDGLCFAMELEEIYSISIADEEISGFTDVQSIVNYIEKSCQE